MKRFITLLLSLFFITNTATALDSVDSLQSYVVDSLNSTVVTLKEYFKKTDKNVKEEKVFIKEIKEQVESLKNTSSEKETNPTVLKQGVVEMPNCNTARQELVWNNNKWACITPSYGTDCYPAKDEYRYTENGKTVCSKRPKDGQINYYWEYQGLSVSCNNHKRDNVYGCYYKNKNNKKILVNNSYCSGKSKPYVEPKVTITTERKPFSVKGSAYGSSCINYGYQYSYGPVSNESIYWNCQRIYSGRLSSSSNKYEANSHKIGDWTYHKGTYRGKSGGGRQYVSYGFDVYRTKKIDASGC